MKRKMIKHGKQCKSKELYIFRHKFVKDKSCWIKKGFVGHISATNEINFFFAFKGQESRKYGFYRGFVTRRGTFLKRFLLSIHLKVLSELL